MSVESTRTTRAPRATRTIGVIPARLASSRFPEKVLAAATGMPLVVHVLEQARKARSLDAVVVAADDPRIVAAVEAAGGTAILTRVDHPNGTSRLAEVAASMHADVFVNIQGDEPEIEPETIDAAVELLHASPWADVATVATPFTSDESVNDPNLVKVVLGVGGRALYFSRAAIPFPRDAAMSGADPAHSARVARALPLRHVGLYAYRASFLPCFLAWPPTPLEETEMLEQLRVLEHGHGIAVAIRSVRSQGIDTAEQYANFVARFRAR